MAKRLPAEWESQAAVQLTWPHQDTDWKDSLPRVEAVFHAIAAIISNYENVIIACGNELDYQRLSHLYQHNSRVLPFKIASDDSWARDHGPVSCYQDNQLELLDFQFNGWGNKYPCQLDNQISQQLHIQDAYSNIPIRKIDLVLEGGSLETDGQGTLLTTTQCLLNSNRNPSLNQAQLEQALKTHLGVQRILWLQHGYLEGDDTDAHIDTLARFCSADTITYCQANSLDKHYDALSAMEQELKQFQQNNGQPYRLLPLPLPSAIYNSDGERLPATYANFLIINQAVLLPVYGVDEDQQAIEQIIRAFPNHRVHPINCLPIIEQHGSLHCLTMQIHTPCIDDSTEANA